MARFVSDVTVPDGTRLAPNEQFNKVWRFVNAGTQAWPKGCKLVHVGGDFDGLQPPRELDEVQPNTNVDVSVQMKTPTKPGRFVSFWRFVTPDGSRFGQRCWCDISVVEPAVASAVASASGRTAATTVANAVTQAAPAAETKPHAASSLASSLSPSPTFNSEPVAAATSPTLPAPSAPSAPAPSPDVSQPAVNPLLSLENSVLGSKYAEQMRILTVMGFTDLSVNRILLESYDGNIVQVLQELLHGSN